MTHIMDPRDRAPTLRPIVMLGVVLVLAMALYYQLGLFSELGSIHQVFWD